MIRTGIAGLVLGGALLLGASADTPDMNAIISAYNQASAEGDTDARISAAKALGEAAMANPERADAALLAYEAGQTLCVFAGCEGAEPMATFATSHPLVGEAVFPIDIDVLAAYAHWQESPKKQARKALDDVLGRAASADLTMLTLTAFHTRYTSDIREGDWRAAKQSAEEAAAHFAPYRQVVGEHWSDASIAAIIAGFNSDPDTEHVLDMARHHVEVGKMSYVTADDPAWLDHHWYLTDAWQMAMKAYFQSGGGQRLGGRLRGPNPDRIERNVDEINSELVTFRENTPPAEPEDVKSDADESTDYCDGTFDMTPALEYPKGAARKGMFGAVIAKIAVENYEVGTVEVLAAVPSATFEQQAEDTIRKWTWRVEKGEDVSTCSPDHPNIILPMVFALDR